jgi:two-component system, cell cycle response regulator
MQTKKPIILIVDDEPINISIVGDLLSKWYQIKVATSAEKALQLLDREPVHLILLDVMMPKMSGYEMAKKLQNDPPLNTIPIIFLTANRDDQSLLKGFESGAVDFISKPFNKRELLARVATHTKLYLLQNSLSEALLQRQQQIEIIDQYLLSMTLDLEVKIVDISSAFCKLLGYSKEDLINKDQSFFEIENEGNKTFQKLQEALLNSEIITYELKAEKRDKSEIWLEVKASPEYDKEGKLLQYTLFAQNITAQKLIQSISEHDHLTGLLNRGKIESIFEEEIERAKRYNQPLSIIMLDIDHFKEVNDTHGHQVGDAVLENFSAILSDHVRTSDHVGRIGGEEFLILSTHTDIDGAKQLSEHLRHKIEEHNFPVINTKTSSFGVTQMNNEDSMNSIIKRADLALYYAKNNGRNRVKSL